MATIDSIIGRVVSKGWAVTVVATVLSIVAVTVSTAGFV
jgi:hypothetical protein